MACRSAGNLSMSRHLFRFERTQGLNSLGELLHDGGKGPSLGGRDPIEEQPVRVNADVIQKGAKDGEPLGGSMIATNIVAVADVSAQDHHAVSALSEGANHQFRGDAPGAHHAHDAYVRSVFQA